MWWIDVLVAGRGDTRDYWGMGSMGLWTVGLLCAPSAGLFYMWFSPTRGLIVLHEVFSYTWVGFLLVCVFYLIMCDRHMLLANQNYFRSDHFTNLCLFT